MLLELINSLFLAFAVTEYLLWSRTASSSDCRHAFAVSPNLLAGSMRVPFAVVVSLNLLLAEPLAPFWPTTSLQTLRASVANGAHSAFALVHDSLASPLLALFVETLLAVAILGSVALAGKRLSKQKGWGGARMQSAAVATSALGLLWYVLTRTETGARKFPARALIVAIAFALLSYADALRFRRLPPRQFAQLAGRAVLVVLPAVPFLAVLASTFFFVVISICEWTRLPTAWLNWPTYYGTLYGPFAAVYWVLKQDAAVKGDFGRPGLPMHATRCS